MNWRRMFWKSLGSFGSKVLEREKVVSLSNCQCVCDYLYNYLIFSTLLLWCPSFHPEFSEKNLSLCFHTCTFFIALYGRLTIAVLRVQPDTAYVSPFLCWLRLTLTLYIVLTGADIQFTRDLLCGNTLKLYFYACSCDLFEDLSLYNLAVETFVLMLTKPAISLSRNAFLGLLWACVCVVSGIWAWILGSLQILKINYCSFFWCCSHKTWFSAASTFMTWRLSSSWYFP